MSEAESPTRRRLSAADRRSAILAAALEVFSERGFHGGSLEDVAARGGVSKALIYEHFDSKRDLERALLEMNVHELLGRVTAAITAASSEEDRLRAGIDAFLAFVEERPVAWRLLFRNTGDPDIAEAFTRLQREVSATIAALMVANAPRTFRDAEPDFEQATEMMAQQLTGAVQSLADWWDDHRAVPRERVLELAMDFAWVGLDRLGRGERWAPR
ncbi:MAG: TetR/AcrR family transcriptional regulator [Solirubrobacterales bacterium]